jgi:nicastrin
MRIFLQGFLASLCLSTSVSSVDATSKTTSLYEPFQDAFKNLPHSPCLTLYHRNGRIGCGSLDRDPQYGPLLYYDGSSKLQTNSDYVAVIDEFSMSSTTISALLASNQYGHLKGIMVLNSTDSNDANDYISPGSQYPLGYGTPSASLGYGNNQFPWNGNGDGLIQYDLFGVPMVYIDEYETSEAIRTVAKDSNSAAKFIAEFTYYMGPDGVKTSDCLSWRDIGDNAWSPKCDPLGGTSVWAHAGSPPQSSSSSGGGDGRPAVIIGAAIDATSMFHDLAPGANTAASNILALLMAAKLLGASINDEALDALPKRIVFGFFQGESYGYLGSRNFLSDVMGFTCGLTVNSLSSDANSDKACLYPLRSSLKFMDIGEIAGMLTVDQVGMPLSDGVLYVHNDGNDGTFGSFLSNVLRYSSTNTYSVAASAAGDNAEEGNYPYPPSPLTSLQSLTEGAIGGAVLTGFDYVYAKRPPYNSHLNTEENLAMNLKSIAASATLLARAALAAAYDDGSMAAENAATYAAAIISELSSSDSMLVELADCLFVNGYCKLLKSYAEMEASNEKSRTGFNVGSGEPLGKPPSYYVSVFNMYDGQPFVQVGDEVFGSYNGDQYGEKKTDGVGVQPRMLEQAIRNMLHDFLGQGAFVTDSGAQVSAQSCKKQQDCSAVTYCAQSGDSVSCSGSNVCVCTRAHYHVALDEAIVPALNNATGYFYVSKNDQGISPMYVEPIWSNVGVRMYRDSKMTPGFMTLALGLGVLVVSFFATIVVKVSMKKEKVY